MTDRELLEYAAKAAGIESFWGAGWESNHMYRSTPRPHSPLPTNTRWNPLDDDGDALRLALACGMQVREREACWWPSEHLPQHSIIEDDGNDPYAATRRAIVRAAAEIGRSKP